MTEHVFTADDAISMLEELQEPSNDRGSAHLMADGALCKLLAALGYENVVKAFENIREKTYWDHPQYQRGAPEND